MMITRTCNCATHRLNEGAGLTWPVRLLTTRPFSFFSLFLGSRFLYPSTCAPTLPRALKSKAIWEIIEIDMESWLTSLRHNYTASAWFAVITFNHNRLPRWSHRFSRFVRNLTQISTLKSHFVLENLSLCFLKQLDNLFFIVNWNVRTLNTSIIESLDTFFMLISLNLEWFFSKLLVTFLECRLSLKSSLKNRCLRWQIKA